MRRILRSSSDHQSEEDLKIQKELDRGSAEPPPTRVALRLGFPSASLRTDAIILDRARRLRRQMTEAERKLWRLLRDRYLVGVKFRRQVPIGNFIADFCCLEARLIVELDGGQHAEQEETDASRSRFLAGQGFRVLRFWNDQVLNGSEFVVERILEAIAGDARVPSPGARDARRPLPKGEG